MSRLIGILGGTFDPIHFGHLRPALEVLQGLAMDEIRFIPLSRPAHREQPRTAASHRMHMVQLAVSDEPRFVADDRELRRQGVSYSLDTVQSLQAELEVGDHLCLLLGADAFNGFLDWHRPHDILRRAHLLIMHRPGSIPATSSALQSLLREHLVEDSDALRMRGHGKIIFYPVTQLAISATNIRELIAHGQSPRYLLPDPVLNFIKQAALYRNSQIQT